MSATALYRPQLAPKAVRKCSALPRCVFQRVRPAHRRSYASAQEEGRSFKGQLYESTAQRLQRERAEQARFAKQRELGSGGKSASLLFGMDTKFQPVKPNLAIYIQFPPSDIHSNNIKPYFSQQPQATGPELSNLQDPTPILQFPLPQHTLQNIIQHLQTYKQHGQTSETLLAQKTYQQSRVS